jgi:flagellum-specific peptidoglycan hydrolase FlgJ
VSLQKRNAPKARSHLSARVTKPAAHAVTKKDSNVRIVNGRMVSKTLADPEIKAQVESANKKMFPNREAFIKEMHRRGVLTRTGKLTKNYGG